MLQWSLSADRRTLFGVYQLLRGATGGLDKCQSNYSKSFLMPKLDNGIMELIFYVIVTKSICNHFSVQKYPIDDDIPPSSTNKDMNTLEDIPSANIDPSTNENEHAIGTSIESDHNQDIVVEPKFDIGRGLPCKWTTGAGPRIGCVRDYPAQLQFQALEQVNLSPRIKAEGPAINNTPVPSPRPSPKFHLSPRLAYMGLPSPRRLHNLSPANSPLDLSATKPHCS